MLAILLSQKQFLPIVVTVSGKVISVSKEHSEKAISPISISPLSNAISLRFAQSIKAVSPMRVITEKFTASSRLHRSNILSGNSEIASGKVTTFTPVSAKAYAFKEVTALPFTSSGTVTVSPSPEYPGTKLPSASSPSASAAYS